MKQDHDTLDYVPEWNIDTFCYELEEFAKNGSFGCQQTRAIM
ncbi:hypothetical protein [Bacillus cereus]|nr:hypothetical protein [Bacillus cereus]